MSRRALEAAAEALNLAIMSCGMPGGTSRECKRALALVREALAAGERPRCPACKSSDHYAVCNDCGNAYPVGEREKED